MIQIIISRVKERTSLFCDKCGSGFVWDHIVSKSRLTGVGRNEGWSMGKLHLCERCRNRRADNETD